MKNNLITNNQKTIVGLLEQMKNEMAKALPKHLPAERMIRIALTELRKTPKLQECEPMSFVASIMLASQLGLEPGVLGACYLIPFFNNKTGKLECTFMPGYRGFLDLARRSGQINSLVSRGVYENDEFSYELGLKENIIHKPCLTNKGELIAVYAVALLKDGGHQFEIMSVNEIEKIRATSKSKDSGPWITNFDEMAKKTVVRRLFKWLPCSVEMQKTVSLDELQELGLQSAKAVASEEFDIDFVIDAELPKNETKEQKLMNKIKEAKSDTVAPETTSNTINDSGECITESQVNEINALMSVKVIDQNYLRNTLNHYNVLKIEELTLLQADEFILQLNKLEDK